MKPGPLFLTQSIQSPKSKRVSTLAIGNDTEEWRDETYIYRNLNSKIQGQI